VQRYGVVVSICFITNNCGMQTAEDRYSRELLTHAESIKSFDALKKQLGAAQATIRDLQVEAETAKIKLATSEGSWAQQKDALDKEISDLKSRCEANVLKMDIYSYLIHRCKDLAEQNNLLHQHLESVSSQAARIKQAAGSTSSVPGETETADDTDTKLSELRAVVAYLRKEKEIVDLQFDLSKQENVRLKAQIEHVSHNLEETRAMLSEVRYTCLQLLQKHSAMLPGKRTRC
jgi:nucleoprotein TPR